MPKITTAGASNAGEQSAPVAAAEFDRPEQGFVMTGQWETEEPAAAETPPAEEEVATAVAESPEPGPGRRAGEERS